MPFFTKKGGGQRNRFRSGALMGPFSLPSFYRFLCSFVTYPRSQTRFPLFFQHGKPTGLGRGRTLVLILLGPILLGAAFLFGGFSFSSHDSSSCNGGHAVHRRASDATAGSSGLGPVWVLVARITRQCASSPRQP